METEVKDYHVEAAICPVILPLYGHLKLNVKINFYLFNHYYRIS